MWTKRPPGAPGFYWLKEPGKAAVVVEVDDLGRFWKAGSDVDSQVTTADPTRADYDPGSEWCGPLARPA